MLPALFRIAIVLPLVVATAVAGPSGTLYGSLGANAGVAAISDALIDRVASDPVLGRSFADTNLKRIKKLLAEQICDLSGGPCHYSGDPMRQVHAGHHISEAEFYRMVDTLRAILRERHVGVSATNALLRLLAPMKRDVVEAASMVPQR
ncbi:MAG TPA: group 1 truncated hemoglobin [Steroidobacteraceae bacterium]